MTAQPPPQSPRLSGSGFTLIELLVVMAIIALLAGLIVGVLPGADRDKKEKTARTQMQSIVTALEAYKRKHGFYPPSPPVQANVPTDFSRPALFYELTGAVTTDGMNFTSFDGEQNFTDGDLLAYGISGLINTGPNPRAVKNFYPGIQQSQIKEDPNPPGGASPLRFLVVPIEGPEKNGTFNTWNYNSAAPVHNPQSYDLWVTLYVGEESVVIGNW